MSDDRPAPASPASEMGRWARWVRFLDQREAGTSLALFRIACGLGVLFSVGGIVCHGMVAAFWLNPADGGYRNLPDPPWQFQLLGGLNPVTLWSVIAVALLSGSMMVVGLGGRVAPLVALQAYLALTSINGQITGGDDYMLANSLWLLVLSRSTATFSLACRLRTGRWTSSIPVPAWPRYLAIYQLVLTYWATGMQKLGVEWTPVGGYSYLYYALQDTSWQRWDMTWLAWFFPLTQVGTALTWFFENAAPLLLLAFWFRNTPERPGRLRAFFNRIGFRRLYIAAGVCIHLGIFALMNVEPFTWVTLSYYVCLFRPAEWQSAWRKDEGGRMKDEKKSGSSFILHPSSFSFPSLRGVLVALHLIAITLMAIPTPVDGVVDRETWKRPDVQSEVAAWSEQFADLGIRLTPREIEDRVVAFSIAARSAQAWAIYPFHYYYTYCGTYQSWYMFGRATRSPTRLHIDVEEDGRWRPVYVARSWEHDWLGHCLDYCRFRPVLYKFGAAEHDEDFATFADWVGRRAARDFPDAARVRVRLYQLQTLPPDAVRAGKHPVGHFRPAVVVDLAKFREDER